MYDDYPKAASNAAKRALKYKEENGSSCGTSVGWTRANQLASRESLSADTVKRTYSFLSRSAQYKDVPYNEGCGGIMYDAWGGTMYVILHTAKSKGNAKGNRKRKQPRPRGEIDGVPVYTTKDEAKAAAEKMGCSGTHEHQTDDGKTVYMPCASHDDAAGGYRSAQGVVQQRAAEGEVKYAQKATVLR